MVGEIKRGRGVRCRGRRTPLEPRPLWGSPPQPIPAVALNASRYSRNCHVVEIPVAVECKRLGVQGTPSAFNFAAAARPR